VDAGTTIAWLPRLPGMGIKPRPAAHSMESWSFAAWSGTAEPESSGWNAAKSVLRRVNDIRRRPTARGLGAWDRESDLVMPPRCR
jgi:hypothetical protein